MKVLRFVLPDRRRACWRVSDQPSVSIRREMWSRAVRRMATRCMQQRETPSTPREVSRVSPLSQILFVCLISSCTCCLFMCWLCARLSSHIEPRWPHKPSDCASQLVDWARQRFYQEVSKPDDRITLAKACMLIALEEEAAAALAQDQLDIRQTLRLSSADPLLFAHPAPTSSRSVLPLPACIALDALH